jgi:hypothetical protein
MIAGTQQIGESDSELPGEVMAVGDRPIAPFRHERRALSTAESRRVGQQPERAGKGDVAPPAVKHGHRQRCGWWLPTLAVAANPLHPLLHGLTAARRRRVRWIASFK